MRECSEVVSRKKSAGADLLAVFVFCIFCIFVHGETFRGKFHSSILIYDLK